MTTLLLVCGAFFIGMAVGIVWREAWDMLADSRRESRFWGRFPPTLPTDVQVWLLVAGMVANGLLAVLLISTRATAERAERQNLENAVTACENANEAREANRTLWRFVLALSAATREEPRTPEEQQRIAEFAAWVDELYAPHDCTDLGREYPIPPPPDLTG